MKFERGVDFDLLCVYMYVLMCCFLHAHAPQINTTKVVQMFYIPSIFLRCKKWRFAKMSYYEFKKNLISFIYGL